MSDRAPWFKCYPSKLLGALGGMTPDAGYTYTVVLLRIYEADGPVLETARSLARRSGLSERRVADALAELVAAGKLSWCDDGRLDSPTTHDELAARSDRREARSEAGKASAGKRSGLNGKTTAKNDREKHQQNQRTASTSVQQVPNDIEIEKEVERTSETSSLRDAGVPARAAAKPVSERDQFTAILSTGISPDRAAAIADHRKRQKWPLSEKAAQLMVDSFVASGDPNAGADLVIVNGWRGFQPDWLHQRQARAGPTGSRDAPRRISQPDRTREAMNRIFQDDHEPARPAQQTLLLGSYPPADEG